MRILVTNDDGINAPGLKIAEAIAAEIAGPDGEVWVVAPDHERSGASHAISYTTPTRISRIDARRYSVDGYPADCVMLGALRLMAETPPDLVISGVNRGHNVAEDVFYSGTVGAAMDAALHGFRGVALSQFFSADGPEDLFEASRAHGAAALRAVLRMPWREGVFYNVNFPAVAAAAVRGMRVCPQGLREGSVFEVVPYTAPNGRQFQFLRHRTANETAEEGSDARACVAGFVAITPMRPQLTDFALLDEATAALDAATDRPGPAR